MHCAPCSPLPGHMDSTAVLAAQLFPGLLILGPFSPSGLQNSMFCFSLVPNTCSRSRNQHNITAFLMSQGERGSHGSAQRVTPCAKCPDRGGSNTILSYRRAVSLCPDPVPAPKPSGGSGEVWGLHCPLSMDGFANQPRSKGSFFLLIMLTSANNVK